VNLQNLHRSSATTAITAPKNCLVLAISETQRSIIVVTAIFEGLKLEEKGLNNCKSVMMKPVFGTVQSVATM
jgi:hypothetical protein